MTRQVLVTGAGSGIGQAIARRFAASGCAVACADIDAASATRTAKDCGPASHAIAVDVSDEKSVENCFNSALDAFDDPSLHVLVNVAGIGATSSVPETSVADWSRVEAVNSRGTFLCCREALLTMVPARHGAIVNIASIAGLVGLRNRAAYCASKGAVIALTRAMALDHVADGIRVNSICPGTVDSPWVRRLVADAGESLDSLVARQPMGRLGTPEEIAEAAHYLASDAAGFITGTALTIDGGLTAG